MAGEEASVLQLLGAGSFGFVMGWQLYFVNRYRKGVTLADLTEVIAALGGTAVLTLFPAESDLLGAYGIGLVLGFIAYFLILVILVATSKEFTREWFLDGRRKAPSSDETVADVEPTVHPMEANRRLPR